MPTAQQLEATRRRLREDYEFYPAEALQIITKAGDVIPFVLKRPQRRLARALAAQREAGLPQRAVVLKARQVGYCLDPSTVVLTADLRWVEIGALAQGQELVGCDEAIPGGRGCARKMRRSVVEEKWSVREDAYRLTMDDGRELIATAQHRFLCRRRGGTEAQWRNVGSMVVGDRIRHITSPWGVSTFEDGWMSGILDGEGCMASAARSGGAVTITQAPGPVYDRARDYLAIEGYSFREEVDHRPAIIGGKFSDRPVGRLVISRTNEIFRLIGQTRPTRFLERSHWWDGKVMPGRRSGVAWAAIVSIEPLGRREMVDIQTSTGTFTAEGFVSHNSTQSQGILIQRATQIPNHLAMTVAHDGDSSAEIFDIGRGMWQRLPAQIRPELAYERNTDRHKYMQFGESSRMLRQQGIVGLNSRYRVQTAGTSRTTAKGRGMTIHSLHLSEVAFWDAIGRRTALANAVPDDPWSLILEESTAKGHNAFKDDWDAAVDGSSGYFACFTPWFEEETYRRRFANEIHQGEFEAALGGGPYGEDEPELLRLIPEKLREWAAEFGERISDAEVQQRTIEHLHWRRYAIPAKCSSDLQVFHAEYPSTPEEAFIATGRRVFKAQFVARVLANVKHTDPVVPTAQSPGPVSGALRGAEHKLVRAERGIAIQVPQKALWVPRSQLADHETGRWRIWQAPQLESVIDGQRVPAGQYVVACDPMSGEENEGELAEHGISVIDHRTLRQVAEYSSRDEPDQVALELLLVALLYNRALIAVEKTGGWGYPIIARLARGYRYPRMFSADVPDKRILHHLERLGWSTDPATKPMMIARGEELLRTETDGIRSRKLASQMLTYVYDERGRANPEPKKLADVLLSWLIVQRVAEITPIKPDRPRGATHYSGATTTTRPRRTKVKAREGDAW